MDYITLIINENIFCLPKTHYLYEQSELFTYNNAAYLLSNEYYISFDISDIMDLLISEPNLYFIFDLPQDKCNEIFNFLTYILFNRNYNYKTKLHINNDNDFIIKYNDYIHTLYEDNILIDDLPYFMNDINTYLKTLYSITLPTCTQQLYQVFIKQNKRHILFNYYGQNPFELILKYNRYDLYKPYAIKYFYKYIHLYDTPLATELQKSYKYKHYLITLHTILRKTFNLSNCICTCNNHIDISNTKQCNAINTKCNKLSKLIKCNINILCDGIELDKMYLTWTINNISHITEIYLKYITKIHIYWLLNISKYYNTLSMSNENILKYNIIINTIFKWTLYLLHTSHTLTKDDINILLQVKSTNNSYGLIEYINKHINEYLFSNNIILEHNITSLLDEFNVKFNFNIPNSKKYINLLNAFNPGKKIFNCISDEYYAKMSSLKKIYDIVKSNIYDIDSIHYLSVLLCNTQYLLEWNKHALAEYIITLIKLTAHKANEIDKHNDIKYIIDIINKYECKLDDTILNYTTSIGDTLLHYCVFNNIDKLSYILINQKCNLNAQNIDGYTPLMIALKNNNYKICELLLQNKCHVNIYDNNGNNEFMPLVVMESDNEDDYEKYISLLLKYGVNINHQNAFNYTITQLAQIHKKMMLYNVLCKYSYI